jgi:hypothetical protein
VNARFKRILTLLMIVLFLTMMVGCGPTSKGPRPIALPTITVYLDHSDPAALVPFQLADDLGVFRTQGLRVRLEHQPSGADVMISPVGQHWPIVGYVTVRPDLLLLAPLADSQFRLRALNHLPMPTSTNLRAQANLVEKILATHQAVLSHWTMLPMSTITTLWRHRHLPWVLVTLPEATRLFAIDPHTAVLAWLGAATGPIPSWVVTAANAPPTLVDRFLAALDLALWYLNTTPVRQIASVLRTHHASVSPWMLKRALHYGYWPTTVFPTSSAYNRCRDTWDPNWPVYEEAVDPHPAEKALGEVISQGRV